MQKILHKLIGLVLLVGLVTCTSDDLSFKIQSAIGFADSEMTIRASESGNVEISLAMNAPLASDATVAINVIGLDGFIYGTDYTTVPAATGGQLQLEIPAGSSEATILYEGLTENITSDKNILFQLESGSGIAIGQPATQVFQLTLTPLAPIQVIHDFNDCTTDYAIPIGFSEVVVPGFKEDRGWGCRNFSDNGTRAVRASAFAGTTGEDNAWLIMNPKNMSGYSNVELTFDVYSSFDGPGDLIIQWSSDYDGNSDPTTFNWIKLDDFNAQLPTPGSRVNTNITGKIEGITGDKFYLAFQYVGGRDDDAADYYIDNLILTGN